MTSDSRTPGITVTGTGSAAAPVDQVTINLGVEIIRPDAGDAFRGAAATVTRLLAVLADDGVDARRVRTLDLGLGPRTEWQENREVLIGYQASQRLLVRLDGLAGVERLLTDVATNSGPGVRIEAVSLTAEHPEQALARAREEAFADARTKADHYARLAGRTIAGVQWVREGGADYPVMRSPKAFGRMAADSAMPIAGGDTEVNTSVTVRWSFAD